MTVQANKKILESLSKLRDRFDLDEHIGLVNSILDIYKDAALQDEADSIALQFLSDNYWNAIKDTELGNLVSDAIKSGKINIAPAPLRSTGAILGEEQPVMPQRITPEVIAKALGAEPEDLLKWDSDNHWSKIDAGKMKDAFTKAGIDFKTALGSLRDLQENRDREMVAEGRDVESGNVGLSGLQKWLGSAYMGLFSPRTKEAIKLGKDPSLKDYGLDVGANLIQAAPVGRVAGLASKALGPGARKAIVNASQSILPPLAEETVDALSYDETENPNRADFNIGRVALGSGVNVGTPYALAGLASKQVRPTGERGTTQKIMDLLTNDPYLAYLDRRQGVGGNTAFGGQRLRDETDEAIMYDILKDLDKVGKKERKAMSEKQLDDYYAFLNDPANAELNRKRDDMLEAQYIVQDVNPELGSTILNIFDKENPGTLMPTTLLGENAKKYGLDTRGDLAYVFNDNKKVDQLNKRNPSFNIPLGVTKPKNSAMSLRYKSMLDTKALKGDFGYPARPTDFDLKVMEFMDDPEFMKRVRGRDIKANLGMASGLNLLTNKSGRESYGNRYITPTVAEDINEITGGTPKNIRDILADPTITRQWDAGFKPRETDLEMWEAYNLYMNAKKQNADESESSDSTSYQPPVSSSRAGSKAGL